jgi:hypothetical protein
MMTVASRRAFRLPARALGIAAVFAVLGHTALASQASDTLAEGIVGDTTHRIAPTAALWRSLLVPGWGQALTGRPITGALFVGWEGVTAMMTLRAVQEESYLNQSGSPNIVPKHQQVQDWVVLWVFNHFFSGAEAFVSAELLDFPKNWKLETMPRGVGLQVTVP